METLFSIANLLVLPFWGLMILAPRWRWTLALIRSPLIVLPPIAIYAALVLPHLGEILPVVARPDLPAVVALLGSSLGAIAAWAHFLTFDLFVGRWIFLDARSRGLFAPLVSVIMVVTLLLGPLGLAGYLAVVAVSANAGRIGAAGRQVRRVLGLITEGSRPLALLALGSFGLLAATAVLMLVDPRVLGGASLWLKPAKFAASIALSAATLALLLRHIHMPARGGRRAVALIVFFATLELVIITIQAARGVASHFNVASTLNTVLFSAMGIGIVIFTIAIGYVAFVAFRQQFEDRALGWGIRLGFAVMLFGSAIAFLMPRPTPAQVESLRAGQSTPIVGAHAVGVADGGPGLPVTKWSTEGGDLRVPHFIGLHALQILPLAGWLFGRRHRRAGSPGRSSSRAVHLTVVMGAAYFGITVTALAQALRGQSVLAPDAVTVALAAAVLIASAVAGLLARQAAATPVFAGAAGS
ncbi:MAG TPA: ABA4-like family protein [Polyangia bacterium]|jgi:hypothetical protein|nr:ABA4-like family protein [Polyangia bacterium]